MSFTHMYTLALAFFVASPVVTAFQAPRVVQPINRLHTPFQSPIPHLSKYNRDQAIHAFASSVETLPNQHVLQYIDQTIDRYQTGTRDHYFKTGDLLTVPTASFSETTSRSLAKSMLWRLIAGLVTFVTSLSFSDSLSTALSIVGSDFFSKSATMFIGERLMNKSHAGRQSGADDIGRSLAKAMLWRVFAIANTLTMSFFIAKNFSMASKIAGSDAFFKTGLMFLYERMWAKIEWGKEFVPGV